MPIGVSAGMREWMLDANHAKSTEARLALVGQLRPAWSADAAPVSMGAEPTGAEPTGAEPMGAAGAC
ncbi:hypothetical protein [Nocardia bovistercoris]|uniref:Uncharacterized protein n=1 Tax=Nocardia bovistercoris TaxID=2785916 RepID=A0A931N1S0_9NOCA|nr:hypothetical protein [Nocardia bovistercoris]MBH0778715.1 hypothetical protein [Nocardia bovistercoris]